MAFIKVTRLYTKKVVKTAVAASKTVNKQAFSLDAHAVESFRPSTVLKGQRATIRTKTGMEIPVAQTVTEIASAIVTARRTV